MKSFNCIAPSVVSALMLASAGIAQQEETEQADTSQFAAYAEEALDVLEQVWIGRDGVNWDAFREPYEARFSELTNFEQADMLIRDAIEALGDPHTGLDVQGVDDAPFGDEEDPPEFPEPDDAARAETGLVSAMVSPGVGYIEISSFSPDFDSDRGAANQSYARSGHEAIEQLRAAGACAWIVDLRSNTGGDTWPMQAALGPILGDGVLGVFEFPERSLPWYYEDGAMGVIAPGEDGEETRHPQLVVENPASSAEGYPPVAVLVSSWTASAGEAILTAFKGRPNARSFGQATKGLSTAPQSFGIGDGRAFLHVTAAVFADRAGETYGGPMQPDVVTDLEAEDGAFESDPAIAGALSWLETQNCRSDP